MNRILRFALAAAAALTLTAPAFAGPLPYYNSPLDTPNSAANAVVSSINGASGIPTAAVLQTVTGSAGAATLNGVKGIITTESLTTAAGAVYTETLTNSAIAANSVVLVEVGNGTNSAGSPALTTVTNAAGSTVIKIQNIHASAALNGTLTISFLVIN